MRHAKFCQTLSGREPHGGVASLSQHLRGGDPAPLAWSGREGSPKGREIGGSPPARAPPGIGAIGQGKGFPGKLRQSESLEALHLKDTIRTVWTRSSSPTKTRPGRHGTQIPGSPNGGWGGGGAACPQPTEIQRQTAAMVWDPNSPKDGPSRRPQIPLDRSKPTTQVDG